MTESRWAGVKLVAYFTAFAFLALGGSATAADPAAGVSDAESRASAAEAEIASAQERIDAAQVRLAAVSREAGPAAEHARTTRADARTLKRRLLERQRNARAELAAREEDQRQAEADHDDEVTTGVGVGLAALAAAAIALGWGWFRASAAVAALVRMQLAQAVALCLGGGFLLAVVGAAMAAGDGPVAVLGASLVCLGFILPITLLLGRHSAEVQRGRAKPVLGRDRLPSFVIRGAAVLLAILGLGALGAAILAEQPTATPVSAQLRRDADALSSGPGARRLAQAEALAAAARKQAVGPLARQRAARAELRREIGELRNAKGILAAAEADERRFYRRLAAVLEREEREAIRAQEQAEREAEELEEEEPEALSCDPNYSGCVPPYPPDVDCAEVGGSVSVYGSDPHGLDADSDGVGCE